MIKIINVKTLEELKRENNSIYGFRYEITFSNNLKEEVELFNSDEFQFDREKAEHEIKDILLNFDFKKDMILEVESSIEGDEEENTTMWTELLNLLKNDGILDEDNIELINFAMQTGTIFENFDYKTWILE